MALFRIQENRIIQYDKETPPKVIGSIEKESLILQRNVKDHLNFRHDGWEIDLGLLDTLTTDKPATNVKVVNPVSIKFVIINDETFGDRYICDVSTLKEFAIKEVYDDGERYILPKTYWAFNVNDYERPSEDFVHLHVHSDYSLLDGIGKIEEYVYSARRMGMKALALTDHGSVFGLGKFHRVCKQAKIKPILGSEFYLAEDMMVKDKVRHHIVLLAKNRTGYKNLITLSTKSYLEGFYYRPRIDRQCILDHKDGLIAMSACLGGTPLKLISEGKLKEAEAEILWWKEHFGEDYYIELQSDSLDGYVKLNPTLVNMAQKLGVKIVATNDTHYTYKTDVQCHNVMLGIQKRQTLKDKPGFEAETYWFASKAEVEEMFEEYQPSIPFDVVAQGIQNTLEVANKVEEYDISTELKLPKPIKSESLAKICFKKLEDAGLMNQEYTARLEMELGVITKMQFERYFLMLEEIISWTRKEKIRVGAGRGSVSGSLVAYLLNITQVDPLKFGLLFERFLNVGRKVAPDIDIDFDYSRRDEVVDFVSQRYKVAKISTTVRLNGRGVVRDVAKVMGLAIRTAELISKNIPFQFSIDEAYVQVPQFARLYDENKEVMTIARRLEGVIKTTGQHPAGVIISDENIAEYMALKRTEGSEGEIVVQGDMEDVDYNGLIKVDLLASKTQSILDRCVKETGIELNTIELDDYKVYEAFSKGDCEDIFQFNSDLAIDTLRKVCPENFDDLTAVTALIRPGAGNFIKAFAERSYTPPIKQMEPILAETRNIIIYQEQSMIIASRIAGFDLLKADDLRKAIGKKIPKLMASLRSEFIDGGVALGYRREDMTVVFNIIEKSSGYAFNKSHAVAYTLSSYWSMWFKVHHPTVYAVAEMTVEAEGNTEKLAKYIETTKKRGIKMLPPDINKSGWDFSYDGDGIRCGLSMVKRFSESAYKFLLKHRPFKDFESFRLCLDDNKRLCNKGAIQSLVQAGAFEDLGYSRKALYDIVEMKKADAKAIEKILKENKEWTIAEKSKMEFEALGFYLTVDPIEPYLEKIEKFLITPPDEFNGAMRDEAVRVAGVVAKITPYNSVNGNMAFVDIFGYGGEYTANIWAESWNELKNRFEEGDIVVFQGKKLEGNRVSISLENGGKFKKLNT